MLDWLAHTAISRPDGDALIAGDRQWTYAELNELVAEMAGRLAAAGISAGDHVAVLMPNRAAHVCAIHALMRLGAVLVPLNIRLTPHELGWQVAHADCVHLICSQETEAQAAALLHGELAHPAALRVLSVDRPQEAGVRALADRPAQTAGLRHGRPLDLAATQCIIFTSGTTGRPKGATLSYSSHLASATASAFRLGTLPEDRWLLAIPLYHVGGLAIVLRCCLYGTTVVLPESSGPAGGSGFDAVAVNHVLDTQAVTLISVVPTMLQRLLDARGEQPFPAHLRCVLVGGAGLPPALLQRCLSLGVPVATTYGLTEAASQVATASPAEVRRTAGRAGPGGGHFAGRPLMFTQVRILGEHGADRPAGEPGEIAVCGPTVMTGYHGHEPLRAGRLHTGDMGYLDAQGDLWVVQRRSDLIVTGGENVYPSEVEGVLLDHPDVVAACVVGLDDPEWGQRVAAAVVVATGARVTAAGLETFCRARLAGYKRPRSICIVSSLPQTASGKVRRDAVAEIVTLQAKRA